MSLTSLISIAATGTGLAGAFGLFSGAAAQRSIAGITPQITVEEEHDDELMITEHPVELGATVTDHSYLMPPKLKIVAAWSESPGPSGNGLISAISDVATSVIPNFPQPGYLSSIYNQMLALQQARTPFTIVTGKRTYTNMLLQNISEHTSSKTEHSLVLTMRFKQIFIAQTQIVTVPPATQLANPEANQSPVNNGTKQVFTSSNVSSYAGDPGALNPG